MDNEWGDFGIDGNPSGMELEPMDSSEAPEINFGGNGFDTPAQAPAPQNNNGANNKKKVLVVSCIVSIVLLVVILFIWSVSRENKQVDTGVNQTQPQQTQPVQKTVVQPANKEVQWVEVDPSEYLKDVKTEQGYFTVNNIKTMAMLKGSEKGNFLRAILTGNITGMQGEFELVIPVTSVEKVSVGSVINVEYSYINVKDSKIIVDIK